MRAGTTKKFTIRRRTKPMKNSTWEFGAMIRFTKDLIFQEEGATMLEYAVMLGLIAATLIGAIAALSNVVSSKYHIVATDLR